MTKAARNINDIKQNKPYYKQQNSALPMPTTSTVPGRLPHMILYSFNEDVSTLMTSILCATDHILHINPQEEQLVILIGNGIDLYKGDNHLIEQLKSVYPENCLAVYDAGVREYDSYKKPVRYELSEEESKIQEDNVRDWLRGDRKGILVTHNHLFAGLEAPSVVYITRAIDDRYEERSALMRAVGRLVIIQKVYNFQLKLEV